MIGGRHVLVLGTFLLAVLLYVDRVCISTARDPITRDLGLTDTEFGWALSSFALGYALFQAPTGALADRYGPRLVLTAVVVLWSAFTGLTGAATGLAALLAVRFLFGAGEAGAFPGMARAIYAWIPMRERGVAQGVNFAGARVGAAVALPAIAGMVEALGWRETFVVLMLVGFVWAVVWFVAFRDDPAAHPALGAAERELILATRQPGAAAPGPLPVGRLLRSGNLWLLMGQYFCSNFTFFFCLTWLFPHLKRTYELDPVTAGWYAAAPFVGGAVGNVWSGWLTDRIYRAGRWRLSRQLPAVLGFALAAGGLVVSAFAADASGAVLGLTVAVFGTDMTVSASWAACVDVGREHAGAVSGTMNMAGNLGSFVTALAFPYLLAWTGSVRPFFFTAAALSLAAAGAWAFVQTARPLTGDETPNPGEGP
jgi:ACS family glucarate transporter-like MFS transporter